MINQNEALKRKVSTLLLNVSGEMQFLTIGRSFYKAGPARAKAHSPKVFADLGMREP